MQNHLIEALKSGLLGQWTHIDPKKALVDLTPTIARKKTENVDYSCWDLLHHIVIWCDVIIKQIKGDTLNWNDIEKKDWPSVESMKDDNDFHFLVERFHSDLEEIQNLLEDVDFSKMSTGWPELPIIKLFLVFLQHTSYHIGQIVVIRKILGDWPVKESDK